MIEVIEIPLSKKKTILSLIGAMIFVMLGLLFIIKPESFKSTVYSNSEIIRIAGIASVSFFGLCSIFITKKLFDKKFGLRIDQNGINDNSSATSVGFIDWEDIKDIKTIQVASTKFLVIMTDKPKKYIDRAKNVISKQAMKANQKMYGSPLSIISISLKINFDDLEKLVIKEFRKKNNDLL